MNLEDLSHSKPKETKTKKIQSRWLKHYRYEIKIGSSNSNSSVIQKLDRFLDENRFDTFMVKYKCCFWPKNIRRYFFSAA